jgi:hypothetical protein
VAIDTSGARSPPNGSPRPSIRWTRFAAYPPSEMPSKPEIPVETAFGFGAGLRAVHCLFRLYGARGVRARGRLRSIGRMMAGEWVVREVPTKAREQPTETWAAQDFCSAKALFVPSLKRYIVFSLACTRPPAGGVAWRSTSDGENSYSHWAARQLHTGRRGSVAARGACAADDASCGFH